MTPAQPATVSRSRRYRLRSERIGEIFQIDVALPPPGVADGSPLALAVVLDGNVTFAIAAQAARFLQQADEARPTLVVGVGYWLDGVVRPRASYGALRTRDFTPSIDRDFLGRQALHVPAGVRPAGGADDFLSFLIDDLRPFIASRYEVDLHDQTLVGSSLGGLFSLYAMLKRPGAFRAYAANSPSLWWNRRELFRTEGQVATDLRDLAADLFVSVGGEERQAPWNMREDLELFTARMAGRAYPGLRLTAHVFEDESHTSVIPAALSRSLRTLLAPRRA